MGMFAMELSRINFKENEENRKESKTIFLYIAALSLLYSIFALCILHQLWYHYLISVFSGIVFGYVIKEWYFEKERKKFFREVNEFIDAFARCYEGNHGNVKEALISAQERGSIRMKRLISKLVSALESEQYADECEKIKNHIPLVSLKSFIEILVVLKGKGRSVDSKGEDHFLKAFQALSSSISQQILHQERSDVDNKTTEIWILLAPLVVIPGTLLIYLLLFQEYFDILSCYRTLEAKTTAALTFLFSSIGALFVNWVRNNR